MGKQKMSKSLGSYVALNDPPAEMFGKLMSISRRINGAIFICCSLSRELPKTKHPLEAKKELAAEIVATYHSRDAANKAQDEWTMRFSEKRLSETELPILPSQSDDRRWQLLLTVSQPTELPSHAPKPVRLIKQGSVQLDGAKLRNPTERINLSG